MNKNLFYKKGVSLTNDKQMFNFLHNHFRYDTMSSWNRLQSLANNVKLNELKLDGDWMVAYQFLQYDQYNDINSVLEDWEVDHPGYKLGFNGRSGGYLVLYNDGNNSNILPDHIANYDYEDYKQYCKDYNGSVRGNRYELQELTKLVQDFDKLCDELREQVNDLSLSDFKTYLLEDSINCFNADYDEDLQKLKIKPLTLENKRVNIKDISKLDCLLIAFYRKINAEDFGLRIIHEDDFVWVEDK